jgi:large repetitive protein
MDASSSRRNLTVNCRQDCLAPSGSPKFRATGFLGRAVRALALSAACFVIHASGVAHALPIAQEWFVPQPEAQIRADYLVLAPGTNTITDSVIAITVPVPGTKIVLDHWEDGYEVNLGTPTQTASQIWGDGNDANGKPPGYANDPASFTAGSVIIMRNQVPLPRNASTVLYDGRDRFGATFGIVMTRAAWFTNPGPLLANSVEVRAVPDWGTSFVLPVGENIIFPTPLTSSMFEHCSAYIMASQPGTVVTIDLDGNGTTDSTVTLNQGESHLINAGIQRGARINSTKPIQVMQFYGDIGANYEARGANVPPLDRWSDDYYAPVGTASDGDETYIYLHNPDASAITINFVTKLGSGSFSIPGKGTHQYLMPKESAARFTSVGEKPFWGVGMVGARPTANNVHDWGYALVPKDFLSTEVVVGWGAGSDDGTQNGSPVWVTSAGATTIYIDYDGDRDGPLTDPSGRKYDVALPVTALTVSRVFDPDMDQSAMRLYTLDGTLITAAWGQDPATAGPARPFLDLGNTTPNYPVPLISKVSRIATDNSPAGLSVGDVMEYTVTLDNKSLFSLTSVPLLDNPPAGLTYVLNSTTRDAVAVPDSVSGTAFPLDGDGLVVPILPARQSTVIKFRATITTSGTHTNTATLIGYPGVGASDTIVVPSGPGPVACTLKLTNSSGTEVNYQPGDNIYVTVNDTDSNTNGGAADTIIALVTNNNNGDVEAITLTETGVNSGTFRNTTALPSSTSAGLSSNDGTLNVQLGHTITATHVDPAYGDTCPDTATITAPSLTKQLYLDTDGVDSDTTGDLDRVDPVASADATTSETSLLAAPVTSTIANGTTTTYSVRTSGTTSHSFAHSNSGTDRLLVVTIAIGSRDTGGTAGTVSAVTYAGTAMTQVGTTFSTTGARVYIYALSDNPTAMANSGNVVITTSAGPAISAGATTFTGVNQTTPYDSYASASSATGTTAISVGVASAVGERVVAVAAGDEDTGSGNQTITVSSGTSLWAIGSLDRVSGAASTTTGAVGTVNSTFTLGVSNDWAAGAISLNPAVTSAGSALWTQTPNFAKAFTMPAGGSLGVRSYVRLDTGTLSGTPSITATVKNGSTSIATLASPTATLIGVGTAQTIAIDGAASTGSATEADSGAAITGLNVTHTTGSGNNRLMLAGISIENDNGGVFTISSVRWVVGPVTQDLTLVTTATTSEEAQANLYSLTNPTSGAGQLQITVNSGTTDNDVIAAGVMTFSNVDQSTPLGTAVNANGYGTAASISVASATGQLVFDTIVGDDSRGLTVGPGQTSRWNSTAGGPSNGVSFGGSTEPGATSVTMSWTQGASDAWGICAVPIRPYAPPIYQLDWSTTLGSAVNLTSGQSLNLSIANTNASTFRVLYDSSTYPSRINLPTNTVIETDTVEVFSAPYPGGTLVTTPTIGQTLYVRVTASDPFGAYDITSMPLVINGPGTAGDISTTLSAGNVVATTASTKTYEYVWSTGSTEGNFTITATAKEGLENTITSSKSTSVNISSLDLGTPSTTEFTTGNNGPHTLTYATNQTIFARVVDLDENTNPLVAETITVTMIGSSGDTETVTLTETGPNTGIFTGGIPASSTVTGTSGNGTLYAVAGSVPVVNYVDNDDPTDTGNDTAVIPIGSASVAVSKTLISPADGQILVGETAQYRLRVTNNGNTTLATVQAVDTFNAAQLTYVSASPAPNTVAAGSLTWTNVGPLTPGQSVDLIVDFTGLAAAAPSTNTVNVTTGGGPTASDTEPVTITRPAVTVTKTLVSPNPGPAAKGDNVVFNISVQNTGTTALATVPLEDLYSDAFFEFVSATVTPDGVGSGSLLWNDVTGVGNLAVNATFSVSVTLRAKGVANPATNSAAVNYAVDVNGDPVPPSQGSAGLQTLAATISGYTYEDQGAAGFGGDIPLEGVVVNLYTDPNGDGNPADGTLIGVTTTSPTGYYEFLNLGLGKYVVVEEDILGYISVADTAGANDNRIPVNVVALTVYPNNNFLDDYINPTNFGGISGQVRNDTDGDGSLADADSGLAGAVITLYTDPNGDGDPSDGIPYGSSVTTPGSGNYSFSSIPPGTYVVVETDPSGYVSTADVVNPSDNWIPVTAVPSTIITGRDFLDTNNLAALPAIGDRLWLDEDSDGIQDAGEPGLGNVEVNLYDPSGLTLLATTVTDNEGNYIFTQLAPAAYIVRVATTGSNALPAGLAANPTYDLDGVVTAHQAVVNLLIGQNNFDADFGYNWAATTNVVNGTGTGAIGDRVWIDADGDGKQDPGEAGLSGVQVQLYWDSDANGGIDSVLATTTTAADGSYIFDGLAAGIYQVVVTAPSGFVQTGDPDYFGVTLPVLERDNQTTQPIVLAPGDVLVNADFGYQEFDDADISGVVYFDANANDTQNAGEPGISGVTVVLENAAGDIIATTVTDGSGSFYLFPGLPDGTYTIRITDTAYRLKELTQTQDPDVTINRSTQVTIANHVDVSDRNFGFTPNGHAPAEGLIGDTVFLDVDGDGVFDSGEPTLEGVTVELRNGSNVLIATTRTKADGTYAFGSLADGNYTVTVVTSSLPNGGVGLTNTADPDDGTANQSAVTISGANINLTQDFGYQATSPNTIAGTIWNDTNADGTLTESASGIAGISVVLRDASGDIVGTTTTNSNGDYSFPGLPNGTYTVDVTDSSNLLNGYWKSNGSSPGSNNNSQIDPYSVSVSGGATNSTADFGYYVQPSSIGNFVWNDVNSNGIQDLGETGIAGVAVRLTVTWPNATSTVLTTLTDASGYYSFGGLLIDENHDGVGIGEPTFSVSIPSLPGTASPTGAGTASTDSNNSGGTTVSLAQGQDETTIDFGFYGLTLRSIAGVLYDDRDFDNLFTAPDTRRSGSRVQLYIDIDSDGIGDPGELVGETFSDSNGDYSFGNLLDGNYIVKIVPALRCFFVNERGESAPNLGSLTDGQMKVTLSGSNNLDNDFLLCRGIFTGAIGDRVWLDENSDGVQDAGEAGISNVTVRLIAADGVTVLATTVTDSEGHYLFPNRTANEYTVQIDTSTLPAGLAANPTYDQDGLGSGSVHETTLELEGSQLRRDIDFGYNWGTSDHVNNGGSGATGAIGDLVWIDANGNGRQDPEEPGFAGLSVKLYGDTNADGVIDSLVATTTTAADGSYYFDGLASGVYRVVVNNGSTPSGYTHTGDPDAFLSSSAGDNQTTTPILLGPGDVFVNADFGYQPAASSAISGTIYLDFNADANKDAGDPGVKFVSVALLDDDGNVVATTMTEMDGTYLFDGIPAGNYTVWVNDTYRQLGGRRQIEDQDALVDARHTVSTNGSTDVVGIDFGYTPSEQRFGKGLIGDTVFLDRDGDNALDAGEAMRGVTVVLLNSSGTTQLDETITDANGNYFFGNLDAGTYIVRVLTATLPGDFGQLSNTVDPDGGTASESTLTITTGQINLAQDFAYRDLTAPNSISGTLWNDRDADGTLEGGESGRFEGLFVVLYDADGDEIAWTTSASNGTYSFSGLPNGTYTVGLIDVADVLHGYWHSLGASVAAGQSQPDPSPVVLTGGQSPVIDFGYYVDASAVGNFVWKDTDQDGIQDGGEPGIAGVVVELVATWPNSGGTTKLVTTTDSLGAYSFGNLLLDENHNGDGSGEPTYVVRVVSYPGIASPTGAGGDPALDSNNPAGTTAAVVQGSVVNTYDFGFYNLYGSIAGTIRIDADGDNDGDTAQSGVVVELLDTNGASIDSDPNISGVQPTLDTTDGSGEYLFPLVLPGNYQIRQTVPSGYVAVNDIDGGDFTTIGSVTRVSVADAQAVIGKDFVNAQLGSISGTVLADTTGNGTGDTPLGGVTLTLKDASGNDIDSDPGTGGVQPTTTTTAVDGTYLFDDLPPGTYRVVETDLAGYISLTPNTVSGIVVTPGDETSDVDFVDTELGSISGTVRNDTTGDGNGDSPIEGVTITLKDGNGDVVDTTTTAPNGTYSFPNLPPGSYTVVENDLSGYFSVTSNTVPKTVLPGENAVADFVDTQPGSITGTVRKDTNADNLGDTAFGSVELRLVDASGNDVLDGFGVPITTLSAGDGTYSFTNLFPGTYGVLQTPVPTGFVSLNDKDGGDPDEIRPIVVLPAQANTLNDFVLISDCPSSWAHWKQLHPGETAGGNPDTDAYDNMAEFAFAMPYDSGVSGVHLDGTAWIIRPSASFPGTLEAVFVRPKGAPTNVTYKLQYASALGNPTTWNPTEITINVGNSSAVDNLDCTETVTVHDLEGLTGLTGGEGFVRIKAQLEENTAPPTTVDHTSLTEVEGWTETTFGICCQTYNVPYLYETQFTGTVTAVNGQDLAFSVEGDLSGLLGSGAYFLEVTSGDNEGHRFDVIAAGGNEITVDDDDNLHAATAPFNTLIGAPPGSLVGDTVALRRHRTLDGVFPPGSFGATGSDETADEVQVFVDGMWKFYWLYDENDGNPATAHWVELGAVDPLADVGSTIIPPGQGLFFNNRTAATQLLAYGEVRENDFIRPLRSGNSLVGGGYPINQSPSGTGGRAMSTAANFFADRDFKVADAFFIWRGDTTPGISSYDSYVLLAGSLNGWIRNSPPSPVIRNSDVLLIRNRAVFVRSKNGLPNLTQPAYKVPSPWRPNP